MSQVKTIKNFTYISIAEIISYGLLTALYIFVARTLGVNSYGQLSFSIGLISFFNIFADFGLTTLGIREISRAKEHTNRLGSTILTLQLFLSVFLLIILVIILLLLPLAQNIKVITFVYGIGMFVQSFDMSYIFQAHEQMQYSSLTKIIGRFAYLALGFILILTFKNILAIPFASIFGTFLGTVFTYKFLKGKLNFRLASISIQELKELTYDAIPFVSAGIFSSIYHSIDSIFIQFIEGSVAVGYYAAGYRVLDILVVFTSLLSKVFFPQLSQAFKQSTETFQQKTFAFAQASGLVSIPLAVGGAAYAKQIITLLYGHTYLPGAPSLAALAILIAIITFNIFIASVIIAIEHQKQNTISVAIGAIINIMLNFILIPRFGIIGAAEATIASELTVCIYLLVIYQQNMHNLQSLLYTYLVKPILCSLLFFLLLTILRITNLFIAIPFAGVIYIGAMIACNGIPREYMKLIINRLHGSS